MRHIDEANWLSFLGLVKEKSMAFFSIHYVLKKVLARSKMQKHMRT